MASSIQSPQMNTNLQQKTASVRHSLILPIILIVWPLAFAGLFAFFITVGYNGQNSGLQSIIDAIPDAFVMEFSFLLFLGIPIVLLAGPISLIMGVCLLIKRLAERSHAKD